MNINDPNFFFTNYVGHSPDDFEDYKITKIMIDHYRDSGLEEYLPQIYDACALDGKLTPDNIPYQLWEENNLIKKDKFYLHNELKLTSKPPIFDPTIGEITHSYYCEMKERYTFEDILSYANVNIKSNFFEDDERFSSILKYMFKRYSSLKRANCLDMILFVIDECTDVGLSVSTITEKEEIAANKIIAYHEKLKQLDKDHVVWRTYTSN